MKNNEQNDEQKKPSGESKEEEIAELNKLMLLAAKGDKEAFAKMMIERWDKMERKTTPDN